MKFRAGVILFGALLFGCDERHKLLEEEYEKAATADDECRIATKIADLYLETDNAEKYREWSLRRDTDCLYADTLRQTNLR